MRIMQSVAKYLEIIVRCIDLLQCSGTAKLRWEGHDLVAGTIQEFEAGQASYAGWKAQQQIV